MRLRDIPSKNIVDYEEPLRKIIIKGQSYRLGPNMTEKKPDVFFGLGFGFGKEYNEILAESIIDAKNYFGKNIPIYVQTEIGDYLTLKGEKNFVVIGKQTSDSRVTTLDVFNDLKRENKNFKEIAYFAHPAHVFRVIEIGKKQGLEGEVFLTNEVVWLSNDSQKWVRSPKSWKKKERLVRSHHWLLGWVLREI